jgi:hypothetical protein
MVSFLVFYNGVSDRIEIEAFFIVRRILALIAGWEIGSIAGVIGIIN